MAYKKSNTAYGSTGVKTITVGFQPIGYRLTVHPPTTGNGKIVRCIGGSDGTVQTSSFVYGDGTTFDSGGSTSKVTSLYDDLGAGLVEAVAITHNSFTATQFKINVNTANANYDIDYEAWS